MASQRCPTGTTFDVVLVAIDPVQRTAVLKVVRDVSDLGLNECEGIVDHPPSVVKPVVGRAEAFALRARLEDFGARAELRQRDSAEAGEAAPADSSVGGLADELDRIAALHRDGTLSDAEFAATKAKILGV